MGARIEIVVAAVDQVTKNMQKMSGSIDAYAGRAQSQFQKLNSTLSTLRNLAVAGFVTAPIIGFLKSAVANAREAEEAEAQLTAAVDGHSDALIRQAKTLQANTTFDDEDIMSAQVRLGMFIKEEAAIRKLMPAVLDLAAAKKISLVDAAELVRKGMTGTTTALSKYGIVLEGAAGTSKRMSSILSEVNAKFGGQAAALAGTTSGQLKMFTNQWNELKEDIGRDVLPVLSALASKLIEIKRGIDMMFGESGVDLGAQMRTRAELGERLIAVDKRIADEKKKISLDAIAMGETEAFIGESAALKHLLVQRSELIKQGQELNRTSKTADTVTIKGGVREAESKIEDNSWGGDRQQGIKYELSGTKFGPDAGLRNKRQQLRKELESVKIDAQNFEQQTTSSAEATKNTLIAMEIDKTKSIEEIDKQSNKVRLLEDQYASEMRKKMVEEEMVSSMQIHASTASALMNLGEMALSNNKKQAKKNRDIMIAMAIIDAGGAAVTAVYSAMKSGGNVYLNIIRAVGAVASIVAMTAPRIASMQNQSFSTGTSFAPGGVARVHQDETIYLPRGSRVETARESRSGGNIQVNFNAPVTRESLPDIKRELRTLGNAIKNGIRGGQIRPSQIGLATA